ncbi:hypothetical protein CC2G_011156 [Coprinopsis cinerea AmutBmut pab1-1]|nr:hypothetical protein CC2G_011156 [Coprinopsis cinerea AmutBmut pab1-1]
MMACPILDLPSELLAKVALHTSHTTETHPSTVKSCMLTCKTFAEHFRPHAFRRAAIELERSGPIERLLAILSANPRYGRHVKDLVILGPYVSTATIHCPALPELLRHLTEVTELTIARIPKLSSLPVPLAQSISSFFTRGSFAELRIFLCRDFPLEIILNARLEVIRIFDASFSEGAIIMESVDAGSAARESIIRELEVSQHSGDVLACPQRLLTSAFNSLETMAITMFRLRPFHLNLAGLLRLRRLHLSLNCSQVHYARQLVTNLALSLPSAERSLETISLSFGLDNQNAFMNLTDSTAEWGKLEGALKDRAHLPRLRGVNLEFTIVHLYAADPLPDADLCQRRAKEKLLTSLDVKTTIRVNVSGGSFSDSTT